MISEQLYSGRNLPPKKLVLTIDDGPTPNMLPMATFLHSLGIQASFFIVTCRMSGFLDEIKKVIEMGHLICNHTDGHVNLTKTEDPVGQVRRAYEKLKVYTGSGPQLFRPPFGAWNSAVAKKISQENIENLVGPVFWNIGGVTTSRYAADWSCWQQKISVEECADRYFNEVSDNQNGIILTHEGKKTLEMLQILIPRLLNEKYEFLRCDESLEISKLAA